MEKLIKKLIETIEKTENFTLEHAPDVCKELIDLGMLDVKILAGISGSVLVFSLLAIIPTILFLKSGLFFVITCFAIAGLFFISLGYLIASIIRMLVIKTGPKVFILNELKDML